MQSFRFQQSNGSPFSGSLIDRSNAIQFSLNGRTLKAFAGDTLLSALLANGCRGWRQKSQNSAPMNQDTIQQICLDVASRAFNGTWHGDILLEEQMKLEMAPKPSFLKKITQAFSGGKGFHLELPTENGASYFDLPLDDQRNGDVVIVGGGIAGLQAALSAADLGRNVTLVERSPRLGGMCDYYGQADDEEAPSALIDRLTAEVSRNALINVEVTTTVLDVRPNRILTLSSHQKVGEEYRQQLGWIEFDQLILAMGADYNSNLSSATNKTQFANQVFRMAADYGVMPARSLSVITGGNSGYRLAQLLLEAGVDVDGLYDPRTAPTSRHIDFAKAMGVRMHFGETAVGISYNGSQAEVEFGASLLSGERKIKRQFTNLIISNAPRPSIDLWVRAGGNCHLDALNIVHPIGPVHANIAIVGSAFGSISQEACLSQAKHVVRQQLNHSSDETPPYLGMYKYESPAKSLELSETKISIDNIRKESEVPCFSAQPNQHAISEYLFERSGPNLTIGQMKSSDTTLPISYDSPKLSCETIINSWRTKFNRPTFVSIQPTGYLNLSIGQLIYDGDGVNQKPKFYGVVVGIKGGLKALVEGQGDALLDEAYVQTRTGLFAAKLGDLRSND